MVFVIDFAKFTWDGRMAGSQNNKKISYFWSCVFLIGCWWNEFGSRIANCMSYIPFKRFYEISHFLGGRELKSKTLLITFLEICFWEAVQTTPFMWFSWQPPTLNNGLSNRINEVHMGRTRVWRWKKIVVIFGHVFLLDAYECFM